jgi:hypothetical protein
LNFDNIMRVILTAAVFQAGGGISLSGNTAGVAPSRRRFAECLAVLAVEVFKIQSA